MPSPPQGCAAARLRTGRRTGGAGGRRPVKGGALDVVGGLEGEARLGPWGTGTARHAHLLVAGGSSPPADHSAPMRAEDPGSDERSAEADLPPGAHVSRVSSACLPSSNPHARGMPWGRTGWYRRAAHLLDAHERAEAAGRRKERVTGLLQPSGLAGCKTRRQGGGTIARMRARAYASVSGQRADVTLRAGTSQPSRVPGQVGFGRGGLTRREAPLPCRTGSRAGASCLGAGTPPLGSSRDRTGSSPGR